MLGLLKKKKGVDKVLGWAKPTMGPTAAAANNHPKKGQELVAILLMPTASTYINTCTIHDLYSFTLLLLEFEINYVAIWPWKLLFKKKKKNLVKNVKIRCVWS